MALARVRWLRPLAFKVGLRLEGGQHRSATARRILKRYHDVEVGAYSYGACMRLGGLPAGTKVGRYVSTTLDVLSYPSNHPIDRLSTHPFFYGRYLGVVEEDLVARTPLTVEGDAWIGAGAIITAGCRRIGVGAVVGAGAVVTRDVDDFSVVAGNPARVIGQRFTEELRDAVIRSEWWERPIEEVASELDAMVVPLDSHHPLLSSRSRS